MITGAIASIQAAEALKILIGSQNVRKGLLTMDLWGNHIHMVELHQNPNCPVCAHGQYTCFGKTAGSYTISLCGSNSVQVAPATSANIDFDVLAEKLRQAGDVRSNQFTLVFSDGTHELTLFRDGRAIIKNAIDENHAKSLYTEYVGL